MTILTEIFYTIVPLIVLLGILIFVHELGHFSVAKYFGVRVEVFSLGFGRKLFKRKVGDTEYCLSAIPFGGYVKMFGDDPQTPVAEDQKKFSFSHKTVGPRIAIVLAGPLMNALFAFLVFTLIAVIGEDALKAVTGDILPHTEAYKVGFRSHDTVTKVNGQAINKWDDFKKNLESNSNQLVTTEVLRDGQLLTLSFTPASIPNKNVMVDAKEIGDLDGLTYLSRAPVVGISSAQTPAYKAGIRTFDLIESIDGKKVNTWDDAVAILSKLNPKSSVKFSVSRFKEPNKVDSDKSQLDLTLMTDDSGGTGLESSELYLARIVDGSSAQLANLEVGDRITSLNGVTLKAWDQVIKTIHAFNPGDAAIKVSFVRNGVAKNVDILPKLMTQTGPTGEEQKNYALGVITGLAFSSPETFLDKKVGFVPIVSEGFKDTVNWTVLTAKSFAKLVTREVSAKSIGGPLMIGKLATDTWKIGLSAFLKIMGIISINLFLLNLLPIPVLDGGHLLFFTIELFKGSPLSFRKLEIMQQMGMALLLALMVFAVFNDISRFFHNAW